MRTTYPEAYFNFIDVTALSDSHAASTSVKDFANTALLQEDIEQTVYGTMELNQFVLDGSREIFPRAAPEDVPFWSDEKSDESGCYTKNPTLEISFTETHGSVGLTLHFAEDIPAEILITWYTLYGTKLMAAVFYPDSMDYFCKLQVQNYGKIVIEFVRSGLPYRYARLDYIEYGRLWQLGRDNIKSASVYEEIDPTSSILSINTASIEIVDTANEFDLSNEAGLWKSLQKEQETTFYEYVDGKKVNCGAFYLDTWDSQSSLVKLSLIDLVGVMDKTNFYDGRVYNKVPAGSIIDAIMASCGMSDYSTEEEIRNTELSGWLGIQSHRAALQQVVFACGAVVDCSRGSSVKIYHPDRYVSRTIGLDRRFQGMKMTLDDYISTVAVSYSNYAPSEEVKEISKSVLPAGQTRIEFGGPYLPESITASSGTVTEAAVNYCIIEMEEETECVLSGRAYEVTENACTASVKTIEAGENAKVQEYTGCTLMDAQRARESAERLLDYLQLRQEVELRYINDGEAVGQWCEIMTKNGGHTTGILNQTLDLTGGNIATAKCRGYSRRTTADYFAGTEIYAGEDGII